MATVSGTNYAKAIDPTAANRLEVSQWKGRVKQQTDDYEFSGSASGTIVNVANLPKGARIIDIAVFHDALGAGTTLQIGDGDSIARYRAAASSTAAGKISANLRAGISYKIGTADDDEIIKITLAGGPGTGTIRVVTTYSLD